MTDTDKQYLLERLGAKFCTCNEPAVHSIYGGKSYCQNCYDHIVHQIKQENQQQIQHNVRLRRWLKRHVK